MVCVVLAVNNMKIKYKQIFLLLLLIKRLLIKLMTLCFLDIK